MSRYKAYAEYKESGVELIGSIPCDWQVWKWKHSLTSPMNYGANEAALDDNRNHPRYIRITDMNADGTLRDDSFKSLPPTLAKDYLLEDGDILVARTGATVGKSFLYKSEFGISCFAGYLIRARVNKNIVDPKFVYWYMQSDQYWKFVSGSQIQATIQNVSAEKYGDMEFAVPDSTILCKKIANFLDHETAKIDTLIAKQQELIKLLKEKRQAVISHAVTKGLNPNAPMRDSGVEWLGEVPEHWDVCKVKHISNFITSGPRGWSDYLSEEGNSIFLQSGDMNNKLELKLDVAKRVSPPGNAEGIRTKLKFGDVVVCITGANTGRVAIAPQLNEIVYINQHLSLIRVVQSQANSMFIAIALSSNSIKSYFSVNQYGLKEGLSLTDIAEAPICIPPLMEQITILDFIKKVSNKLDDLEKNAEYQVALLQERRTALISAAVTGKIDVRDWQVPSDAALAA